MASMHLNGENFKMSFEGKNFMQMGKWTKYMILKINAPQGQVCRHPGAIYMYITIIFKDLLL